MTRLQKYNQIIWAIVGTGALLMGLYTGLVILGGLFPRTPDHQVQDEETLQHNLDAGIRTQKTVYNSIAFGSDWQLNWSWAAVDVAVMTLENPENLPAPRLEERKMASWSSGYGYNPNGLTNLILWNKASGESRLLFHDRMILQDRQFLGSEDLEYVLVTGRTSAAPNNSLYLYSVAEDAMTMIDIGTFIDPIIQPQFAQGPGVTVILLAVDDNGNGKFDAGQEVRIPFRLDIAGKVLVPVAPMSLFEEAQAILDGRAAKKE